MQDASLNDLLSFKTPPCPVDTIPNEILAQIFATFGHTYKELPHRRLMPVCRRWNAVAAGTPELYAKIDLTDRSESRLLGQLQRSGVVPLQISIPNLRNRAVIAPILANAHRLASLHVTGEPKHVLVLMNRMRNVDFPVLRSLKLHSDGEDSNSGPRKLGSAGRVFPARLLAHGLPSLREFSVLGVDGSFGGSLAGLSSLALAGWHTIDRRGLILLHELLDVLALCPQLRRLAINSAVGEPGNGQQYRSVALPLLEEFELCERSHQFARFFEHLVLPPTTSLDVFPIHADTADDMRTALLPLQKHLLSATAHTPSPARLLALSIDCAQDALPEGVSSGGLGNFIVAMHARTEFRLVDAESDILTSVGADPSTQTSQSTHEILTVLLAPGGILWPQLMTITHMDLRLALLPSQTFGLVLDTFLLDGGTLQVLALGTDEFGTSCISALHKRLADRYRAAKANPTLLVTLPKIPLRVLMLDVNVLDEDPAIDLIGEGQQYFLRTLAKVLALLRFMNQVPMETLTVNLRCMACRVRDIDPAVCSWHHQDLTECEKGWEAVRGLVKEFVFNKIEHDGDEEHARAREAED
ncbi:hypothetical protein C8F01DRAFT_1105974 [Mycena amicta]|nr:hypothetical protein C8F01DRAFT_1105974 [Mycena amicta]